MQVQLIFKIIMQSGNIQPQSDYFQRPQSKRLSSVFAEQTHRVVQFRRGGVGTVQFECSRISHHLARNLRMPPTHLHRMPRTATTLFTTRILAVSTGVTPSRRVPLASPLASSGKLVSSVASRAAASLYTTAKPGKWFVSTGNWHAACRLPCLKLLMRRVPKTSACPCG